MFTAIGFPFIVNSRVFLKGGVLCEGLVAEFAIKILITEFFREIELPFEGTVLVVGSFMLI